jgi:hypothetical protein
VNEWSQFVRHVHKVFHEAFAAPGTEPDVIAAAILQRLHSRRNRTAERDVLMHFIRTERGIDELLHFTPLANVPNILRFGLVPRAHLMIPVVRMALNPRFTDAERPEEFLEKNCLSISFPNYRLLYALRRQFRWKWAVLRLDPAAAAEFVCEFVPTNAANTKAQHVSGLDAARRVFAGAAMRNDRRLLSHEPTDPQAEVLVDSVIPPSMILEVCVESSSAQQALADQGIEARLDRWLFSPRRDYATWGKGACFLGEDDYLKVLHQENSSRSLGGSG